MKVFLINSLYRALLVFEYGLYNHWSDLMTIYILNMGKRLVKFGEELFPDGVNAVYDELEVKQSDWSSILLNDIHLTFILFVALLFFTIFIFTIEIICSVTVRSVSKFQFKYNSK